MTLPNGLDGISDAIGTLFGSTGPLTVVQGAQTWGSQGISEMNTLTQEAVTSLLQDNVIRTSPGLNAMSQALFQPGLTTGIPYTLSMIEQFVSAVTGLPVGTWDTVNEALLALEGIASNTDLEANWTTIFTDLGVANASALASWLAEIETDIIDGNYDDLWKVLFGGPGSGGQLPSIPAAAVDGNNHIGQPVSDFPTVNSLEATDEITWDSATTYTDGEGNKSNSIRFAANGMLLQTLGVVLPVQAGQTVTSAAVVSWLGLTYTAGQSPIQIQLIPGVINKSADSTTNTFTAGTPLLLAEIAPETPVSDWIALPGITDVLTGIADGVYTVPGDGSVTAVQAALTVTQDATGGWVNFAACTTTAAGGYLPNMKDGWDELQADADASNTANQTALTAILAAITDYTDPLTFWDTMNTIYQTWATTQSGLESDEIATVDQMIEVALGIDPTTGLYSPTSVAGLGGTANLSDTFDQMWNQMIAALGGGLDMIGLSGVAQLLSGLAINATSPIAPIVQSAQDSAQILATVTSEPVQQNLEQTVVGSGDHKLAVALTGSPITKTASLGTVITAGQAKTFGFLQWMAEFTSTVTNFVVNFYKMNTSGDLVWAATSSNIAPSIPSTMAWILDTISALSCNIADLIGIELQSVSTGNVIVWGYTSPPSGSHPTSTVKDAGFSQNWNGASATTIPAGSINWVEECPYVGIGVGSPPPTPYFPVQTPYITNDTHTMPSWAMFADLILLAGGGGGEGELGGATGYGGTGGSWNTKTLQVGVDIAAETVFTITLGVGGAGGVYFTAGTDGAPTTISWVDIHGASQSVVAAAGFGGNHTLGLSHNTLLQGDDPDPQILTYLGLSYTGGGIQFNNYPGLFPGGGGAGGSFFQFGTAGAAGEAWIVDRQS